MLDEIIEKVAMGELIVMVGANTTDRIGSAVTAVPVLDAPADLADGHYITTD
ncbi:hypothetical protein ACFYWX_14105 [Streptomyces sp. NPDC002888]|uniref:hypothetical protein n=1 Tax=Streptomyces sp. NPDC002888 TaxID=3364668 RepID=UPI0036BDC897